MLKEIYEQPRAIADTLRGRFYPESGQVNMDEFGIKEEDLRKAQKIFIVACGTSWHAALIGKYMIEELARVPVEVDIASEFRYRNPVIGQDSLLVAITQSGRNSRYACSPKRSQEARGKDSEHMQCCGQHCIKRG